MLIAAGIVSVAVAVVAGLFYTGVVQLNHPSAARYPVRGVDVSSYQGVIDWPVLAGSGISFAYIKATEGSGDQDEFFARNLAGAGEAGLRAGAYHFFSFDSPGATQAGNFIATVPKLEGMLPPVVDVEFYGDHAGRPPGVAEVRRELGVLLAALADHYGVRPVIYATGDTYDRYIAGAFGDCDIWAPDWFGTPSLSDGRGWTFWQYSNRTHLAGYSGPEWFIDLNVFNGTAAEFEKYGTGA